ncbi:VOC family protein [Streptomyces sp. SID9913]|uniref:VOC family protein n=1 Tax=Streptomyces sp. SID9913 TaxID=2706117 RepID=UPI0013DB2502|nr:VOC family protein [Streptomyces sp. SID9913]NED17738.1 VOC family protein [Streptomyces sp. SID9913]
MLTTRFVDGAPDWIEVATPDTEGAASFYGPLFGWEFRSAGPQGGGYGFFELAGQIVAGVTRVGPEQGPPAWTVYFQTSDADATAEAARTAGGGVASPPEQVMSQGRSAVLTDTAGVPFGVWQPERRAGLDRAGDAGSLLWAELHTPDVARAAAFFRRVLRWETSGTAFPGGVYTSVSPAGTGEDGTFGGLVPLADDPTDAESGAGPHWLPYFGADDPDAVVGRAVTLGGRVRLPATSVPGVGRLARLEDPYGAVLAVLRGDPGEQ